MPPPALGGTGCPGGSGCNRSRADQTLRRPFGAAQFELPQPAPLFDPAKHFLDPAAGIDRFGVARMAGGTAVNGRAAGAAAVLSHMRRDAKAPHLTDKAPGVVVLVGTQGFLVGTRNVSRHGFGGISLPGGRCLRDLAIDDQGMAVVHEHMASVARLGRVGIGFAREQGLWISRGAVGLVAELDAVEVAFGTLLPFLGDTKALSRT